MKMCKDYVGVSCIDGSCLIANGILNKQEGCQVCWHYRACEDCAYYEMRGISEEECKKEHEM